MVIYKVTNKVTNKSYVGLTTRDIKQRFKEHCSQYSFLNKSINKYGKDNFNIEVIDTALSRKELSEKEQYWISELNTLHPIGYNMTTGGELNKTVCEATKKKMSIAQTGCNNSNFGTNTTARAIYCVTNDTHYDSATDAARQLALVRSNIARVASKERKHVCGYVFQYKVESCK